MTVVLLHFYSARPTPAYGEIARGLRDRGHTAWVGQPALDGGFVFLEGQAVVDRLPGPPRQPGGRLRSLSFMLRLRGHLRTMQPDVVQITPAPWSWLLALGRHAKTAFVNDIRTAGSGVGAGLRARLLDLSAWLSWRLGSAWLYDRTLFLNEAGACWLFGSKWADRADVVPLGVGADFLRAPRPPAAGRDAGVIRFVYLGTIALERNLEQLLTAVRLVRPRTASFRLTLLGPDDGAGSRAAVRDLIARDGLDEVVDLMDPVPYAEVPAVLQGFDVALNYVPATRVQRRQTFLKVLECRALGLPQITTRTPPNAAVVRDGENGLLVEDSAEAYAAAMQRVIEDRDLLARLQRQAAASRAATTWDDVVERYVAVYRAFRLRQATARRG